GPTIMADSTLARAAGVAGGGIAGRRLELGERLAAFREKIALVDGVLDEIPGQQSVQRVRAVDEAVGVDTVRPAAERFQDGPPLVGTLVQADEDRRRTPVAAREERLQVCLARALGLDLDGGDGAQCAAEVGELRRSEGIASIGSHWNGVHGFGTKGLIETRMRPTRGRPLPASRAR